MSAGLHGAQAANTQNGSTWSQSHEKQTLCWESRNKEPAPGWLCATPLLVTPALGTRGVRTGIIICPQSEGIIGVCICLSQDSSASPCSHRGKARIPVPLDRCPCGPQLTHSSRQLPLAPGWSGGRGQPGQGTGQIEDMGALLPWHCTKTQAMDGKRFVLGFCSPVMGVQPPCSPAAALYQHGPPLVAECPALLGRDFLLFLSWPFSPGDFATLWFCCHCTCERTSSTSGSTAASSHMDRWLGKVSIGHSWASAT